MKIYYLTPYCVLRARTNQIGDVRLCEGFAENGRDVELISLYAYMKDNIREEDLFEAYGVAYPYEARILKTPLWDRPNKYLNASVQLAAVTWLALEILLRHRGRLDDVVVVSRSVNMLLPFLVLKRTVLGGKGFKVLPWIHEVVSASQHVWALRNADGVIGTNSAITEEVHRRYGIPRERLAVSLNPITTAQKNMRIDKAAAREKLGLRVDKPLVVYTGKLGAKMKEIRYILEAAQQLPAYHFLFTGGKPDVLAHWQAFCDENGIRNVSFTGFLDNYKDVIYYQFAADVLVSYYTRDQHAVEYNFPNKICEYMLTGNPIVTPDFSATRDVLNENNTVFVEPERTEALVEGIRKAVEDPALAARLARQAYRDVQEVTFQKRTEVLVDFFERL